MPLRRRDGVGRTQISLSRLRTVLRNLLRRRSLRLTREKFCSSTRAEPHDRVRCEFFGPRVCKAAQIVLWSHLMSAQPRSDHRADQGEDLKKGNTQRTLRSTSMVIGAWHRGTRGSIAAAASLPSFLSLLFASGTRPRRRPRVHGTRGAHARSAAAYKRPTGGILLRRR